VSLPALDLLVGIIAAFSRNLRAFYTLTIYASCCSVFVATCFLAHLGSQAIMDLLPKAGLRPFPEVVVHTAPLGVLFGQHAPLHAAAYNVKDGVDHLAHLQFPRSPALTFRWNPFSDMIPLAIGHIGRIFLFAHTSNLPYIEADSHIF
jgi:hypothetical protein